MEFLELSLNLLQKVSVLLAATLVLLLLRPAEVWLGEAGAKASLRRRVFLVAVLSGLAIWGVFLGFDIGGTSFNLRAIGIVVAGYLGGSPVGTIVGAIAGLVYAMAVPSTMMLYVFAASVLDGLLAGLWSKRFGTGVLSVSMGAVIIQVIHNGVLGLLMAAFNLQQALSIASDLELHLAKIAANAIGVAVVMGLLSLVRELDLARREAQASRDQARQARLEALQYQVRPHFLFNLLNTLAYLIRTDPPRARELTLDLSEFLRYTLSHHAEETTLGAELVQLKRYVDLERARFGDELRFEVTCPNELKDRVVVPPLILQPLVENAIRHGARDGHVTVRVEVSLRANKTHEDILVIRVLDDGPGPPDNTPGEELGLAEDQRSGVGLQNVQERLERFYLGQAQLALRARTTSDGGQVLGASAEITVPLKSTLEGERQRGPGQSLIKLREQAREKLRKVII